MFPCVATVSSRVLNSDGTVEHTHTHAVVNWRKAPAPDVTPRIPDGDAVADRRSAASSCARHKLCPSLCLPLHLLCISLLPCRKKHNSFVLYSSQSGSEMGVVSCFLCFSDSTDWDPVAPYGFLRVFLRETEQSHHRNNKSPPLSPQQICV